MRLPGWGAQSEPPAREGDGTDNPPLDQERRVEPRQDCLGLKLIIRQRKGLGIIHLRNISSWGACGITDMPLAVGSRVFFELSKGHFHGARVKWVHRFTIGVNFARRLRPETLQRLVEAGRRARRSSCEAISRH